MKNAEIWRQLQSLRALIAKAGKSTCDIELLSHWARYFCVLAAGLLENALTGLYTEYVTRTAAGPVASYAKSRLITIQNPKADRFVEVARSFDPLWALSLEQFLADDGRKDAVDSIMSIRHQVAHGKNAGITLARISDYLERAVEVIEFIEGQVRPN